MLPLLFLFFLNELLGISVKYMCKKEISIEGHAFGKKNMILERKGELTWIKLSVGDLNENATHYCIERVGIALIFFKEGVGWEKDIKAVNKIRKFLGGINKRKRKVWTFAAEHVDATVMHRLCTLCCFSNEWVESCFTLLMSDTWILITLRIDSFIYNALEIRKSYSNITWSFLSRDTLHSL